MPRRLPPSVSLASALSLSLLLVLSISSGVAAVRLQASPGSADRARGIEAFKQQRYREAISALQKALKKDGQDYEAWFIVGLALAKTKDLKNAGRSIKQALRIKPTSAEAHNGMAYVLLLRNKLPAAVLEAQTALKIDPQLAEPHYFIGVARLRMDARKDALDEAEAAIKTDPRFPPGYLLKSQALVSFYGDVLVSDPKSRAEKDRNRYREAATALERYLQLDPNSENKQTWIEQLESLKVYANSPEPSGDAAVHSSREVTTKVRVLKKPEPGYTETARQNQTSGTVVLKVVFASDGTVKHILVVKGLPDGLTEKSIKAALGIKFIPATINGKPASMFMQLEYSFNLY